MALSIIAFAGSIFYLEKQDDLFKQEGILPKLLPIGLNGCCTALLGLANPAVGATAGFVFGTAYSVTHLTSRNQYPNSDSSFIYEIVKYAFDTLVSTFVAWGVLEICGLGIPFEHAIIIGSITLPFTAVALTAIGLTGLVIGAIFSSARSSES